MSAQSHAAMEQARRQAAERGWPEARGPGQAKLLEAIFANGPSTRRQLQLACGVQARTAWHHIRVLKALGFIHASGHRRCHCCDHPARRWALAPWLLARRQERQP